MKKTGFLVLAAVALFGATSCQKSAQLSGKLQLDDSTKVYLLDVSGEEPAKVDSTLVKGNAFVFEGVEHPDGAYVLMVPSVAAYSITLGKEPVVVDASEGFDKPVKISGKDGAFLTEFARLESEFEQLIGPLSEEAQRIKSDTTITDREAQMEKLSEQYEKLANEYDAKVYELLVANPNTAITPYLIAGRMSRFTDEQMGRLKEWIGGLEEAMKGNAHVAHIMSFIGKEESLAAGKPYIDFTANDMEGKSVMFSDVAGKGKPVLLEMWASWCPYCRKANPSLVEVFNEFKDKGFMIFGLSLDKNIDDWKGAVAEDALPWTNYVVNPNVDSPGKLYNVQGIPFNVLFNGEGVIVERNVDAARLRELLPGMLQ